MGMQLFVLRTRDKGTWRLILYPTHLGELSFVPGWQGPGWYLRHDEDSWRQWILREDAPVESAKTVAGILIQHDRVQRMGDGPPGE